MAQSRQAPPTALRALRAPTSDEVMRKSRRRSTILQTCNMTPCSLYRPTSHNNTSSTNRTGPTGDAPHPGRGRHGRPRPERAPTGTSTIPRPFRQTRRPFQQPRTRPPSKIPHADNRPASDDQFRHARASEYDATTPSRQSRQKNPRPEPPTLMRKAEPAASTPMHHIKRPDLNIRFLIIPQPT